MTFLEVRKMAMQMWNDLPSRGKFIAVGVGAILLTGIALKKLIGGSRPLLMKKNWKKDLVYLYQFPRSPYLPNGSPFCLKLEMFLRRAKIQYEVIGSMYNYSREGKVPFIELNGVQFCDSDFIIQMLTERFHLEDLEADLTDEQKGISRATEKLAENSLRITIVYNRYMENMDKYFLLMGLKPNFIQKILAPPYIKRLMQARLDGHGMGRHTREEVHSIAKTDLEALSRQLGQKDFFFGDKLHNVDIAVWSVLAVAYYMPFDNMVHRYVVDEFKNLDKFMTRMKEHFFPDWSQLILKN